LFKLKGVCTVVAGGEWRIILPAPPTKHKHKLFGAKMFFCFVLFCGLREVNGQKLRDLLYTTLGWMGFFFGKKK